MNSQADPPAPAGIMLFSGDQLHATIANISDATRYSIDSAQSTLRKCETVAALHADVACAGTAQEAMPLS